MRCRMDFYPGRYLAGEKEKIMTITLEVAALVASIVSVIIGLGAVALSVVFYIMSNNMSQGIKDAEKNIEASVKQLQKLSDIATNKQLDMIDKTQSALIKHAWTKETPPDKIEEKAEEKAEEKIALLKKTVDNELKHIIEKQTTADAKIEFVQEHIEELVNRAIDESRKVETEVREETVRKYLLLALQKLPREFSTNDFNREILAALPTFLDKFSRQETVEEVYKMRTEGVLSWDGELNKNSQMTQNY